MVIFVKVDAWPDKPRHYTARITETTPHFPDVVGQMTCVYRDPYKWGFIPRKTWGRSGLRQMVRDLARTAGPIEDHHMVSMQVVWHQSDPEGDLA